MARFVEDVDAGSLSEGPQGFYGQRVFRCVDIAGVPANVLRDVLTNAAIPSLGDAHPALPEIACINKTTRPESGRGATIACEYARKTIENYPQGGGQRTTIDASVIEEKTHWDTAGQRLDVRYTVPNVGIVTQFPSATNAINLVTLSIVQYETTSEADLVLRALSFVETLNHATWFGWAEKTWKIDDIQVRPAFNDGYREVTTTLTYNPRTWRLLVTFIYGGRLPDDAVEGDGYVWRDVRQLADFSALPITVPTKPAP